MTSSLILRLSRAPMVAACILSAACAGHRPVAVTTSAQPEVVATVAEPAASAFDLTDVWYSQQFPAVRLASMQGGLLVVGFVDTACSAACTTTLRSMAAIERETDARVQFLVVTNAGSAGTSADLAAFGKARRLRNDRYTVISGSDDAILHLTSVLYQGSGPQTVAELQVASTLSVLDYNGITVRQRGNGVIDALLESLTLLENMR